MVLLFLPIAGFDSKIDMNLATGTTGTSFTHFPEVLFLSKSQDAINGDSAHLAPKLCRLVVLQKYRYPEFLFGKSPLPSKQLPGEGDGLLLVVIAEGPIPQHLKKGMVVGVSPHSLQVVVLATDAQALLRAGGTYIRELFYAEKDIFELHHPGIGKEKSRIFFWDQRRAFYDGVAELRKVV